MSDDLKRIFLWTVPRTVSTALLKSLSFVEGIQVVNEPYNGAFFSGPERKNQNPDLNNPLQKRSVEINDYSSSGDDLSGFDESVCTYAWIRDELLEASYEDKKILLCKDMAYQLDGKYHMLPRGFRYSFLIRHPAKVLPSWKKMLLDIFGEESSQYLSNLQELPEHVFPAGYGFKELYDLAEYVEKNLGQQPVILDIDDLLSDPPGILSAYCHEMGIPYSPELLSWKAGDDITETWIAPKALVHCNKNSGFFKAAFQSTGFKPPGPPPSVDGLPADVRACVEASMEYYEKLRQKSIKSSPSPNA